MMIAKRIIYFLFLITVCTCSANCRPLEELERLLHGGNEPDTKLSPDEMLEVLKEIYPIYSKKTTEKQNKDVVETLISLSDPDLCDKVSLYSYELNLMLIGRLNQTNIAEYAIHHFQRGLKDGCRVSSELPIFCKRYEEDIRKKNLWERFLSDADAKPEETLSILTELRHLEDVYMKERQLNSLVKLSRWTYENCDESNTILPGAVKKSWLTIPKVVTYMEHFRKQKEEDCNFLALSGEERKALSTIEVRDCAKYLGEQTMKPLLSETLSASKTMLKASKCDFQENQIKLLEVVVDLGTCTSLDCCKIIQRVRENNRKLVKSSKCALVDFIEAVEIRGEQSCHIAQAEKLDNLGIELDNQLKRLQVFLKMDQSGIIYRYISSKVKDLKQSKQKSAKLEKLDEIAENCYTIENKFQPLFQTNLEDCSVCKPSGMQLISSLNWCLKSPQILDGVRHRILLERSGLLSCIRC